MKKAVQLAAILIMGGVLTGCTLTAPKYTASYAELAGLKEARLEKVSLGEVTSEKTNRGADTLSIRSSSYQSPYGTFTAYFKAALEEDLGRADLLDPGSKTEITAIVLRNELNGSGFTTGYAEMEAKIAVKRDGAVVYERTKMVRHEWPSNFLGDIAIQQATQNYPIVVRKLLGEFYSDPDFIAALKTS